MRRWIDWYDWFGDRDALMAESNNVNPLAGKPLRYLIGADDAGRGADDVVTVSPYRTRPARHGWSIAYCNLFDELNTGQYGPYLRTSDTAREYGEGQIDPRGPGWRKNLDEQFRWCWRHGFQYIELDNPDAYSVEDVIGAIELAATYRLKVIAKNPGLLDRGGWPRESIPLVAHSNVYGIIVERGAGTASSMHYLRKEAKKVDLPVWFVAFGEGRQWADGVAKQASSFYNIGVTYSDHGEYGNAIDILMPVVA